MGRKLLTELSKAAGPSTFYYDTAVPAHEKRHSADLARRQVVVFSVSARDPGQANGEDPYLVAKEQLRVARELAS
jgi:hypothetical protein